MKRVIAFLCVLVLMVPLLGSFASASSAPTVRSQAAVVLDYETGEVLFSKDPDTRRSPASMSKVMTAFIVYEEIAAGRLSHDTSIYLRPEVRALSSNGSLGGSRITINNSHHTVETLLRLLMLPSSNAACIAMAEHISGSETAFVARMNETAKELGLSAHFVNTHGASNWAHNLITPLDG